MKFKVSKSKVSIPQRTGEWDVYLDEGGFVPQGYIDNFKTLVLESIAYGVVEQAGAWFKYGDVFKLQGASNVVTFFRDNPEYFEEVKEKTLALALEDSFTILEELEESGELEKLNDEGEEEIYDDEIEVPEKPVDVKSPPKKKNTRRGAGKK